MRSSTRCIVTVALAYALASHGQKVDAQPNQNEPTLKETTDWLESHLVGLSQSLETTTVRIDSRKNPPKEVHRFNNEKHTSISSAKFSGCVLTIVEQYRTEASNFTSTKTTISTVPLDRMSEATWKVQTLPPQINGDRTTSWKPDAYILVGISAPAKVVNWSYKTTSVPAIADNDSDSGQYDSFVLETDDREVAPRLVNAFNHAIKLCHTSTKQEPF